MKNKFVNSVSEVLSHDVGEVLASPSLLLQLLSLYSYLYLGGNPPGTCGRCHEKYYYKLKQNGMAKAQEADKAQKRTCVPAWKGLKFIFKKARHFNDQIITDEQAIGLLDEGFLKESDFKKLPAGYKKKVSSGSSLGKSKGSKKDKKKGQEQGKPPSTAPQPGESRTGSEAKSGDPVDEPDKITE